MENNVIKAHEIKKEILGRIKEAQESPAVGMEWHEASVKKLTSEYNWLVAQKRVNMDMRLMEYIELVYRDSAGFSESMTIPKDEPLVEPLIKAIDLVPLKIKFGESPVIDIDIDMLEPLAQGLWGLFEEHDISFGLGDDGTDETEQDMDRAYLLIKEYKETPFQLDGNLTARVAEWYIREAILNYYDTPRMAFEYSLQGAIAFINDVIATDMTWNDAIRVVLQEIEIEHLRD